jgi:integrase/recombinase XerD
VSEPRCDSHPCETFLHVSRTYPSKGKTGGRTIPLHLDLQDALTALQTAQTARVDAPRPEQAVLFSERGGVLSPATVRLWFHRLSTSLHMVGCSLHSRRRTFITRAARKVSQGGGSLRDVQELIGHSSLAMTQRCIEGGTEAKRKLVALIMCAQHSVVWPNLPHGFGCDCLGAAAVVGSYPFFYVTPGDRHDTNSA